MRDIYRAFLNRVGTDAALALAHDLEHWHGAMDVHRNEVMRLGFAPDGHPTWEDCPHAEARRLWDRAVRVLGSRAADLEFLRACSLPHIDERGAFVRRPWVLAGDRTDHASTLAAGITPADADKIRRDAATAASLERERISRQKRATAPPYRAGGRSLWEICMTVARILVLALAWTTVSAWTVSAQHLSAYRDFRLGASLAAIAAQAGISPEPRVVHRRPALLQELMWQPPRAAEASQPPDSVRKVVFSFYNDELFRIVVDYDPRRTEGLTPTDMIEALSANYGLATLTATGFLPSARSVSQGSERLVVSWEDTDHAVSLTSSYPSTFALVIVSKPVDTLAKVAAADAIWTDRLEAPQRDVERRQQQTQEIRDKEETSRVANRAAFRP